MLGRDPSDEPVDLVTMRDLYPSWKFGCHYSVAGNGPDGRCLWAKRGDISLTADSAGALVAKIENLPPGNGQE